MATKTKTKTTKTSGGVLAPLKRKLGPQPVWAWALEAFGALWWWRNHNAASQAAAGTSSGAAAGAGGGSDLLSGGGGGGGTGDTTPPPLPQDTGLPPDWLANPPAWWNSAPVSWDPTQTDIPTDTPTPAGGGPGPGGGARSATRARTTPTPSLPAGARRGGGSPTAPAGARPRAGATTSRHSRQRTLSVRVAPARTQSTGGTRPAAKSRSKSSSRVDLTQVGPAIPGIVPLFGPTRKSKAAPKSSGGFQPVGPPPQLPTKVFRGQPTLVPAFHQQAPVTRASAAPRTSRSAVAAPRPAAGKQNVTFAASGAPHIPPPPPAVKRPAAQAPTKLAPKAQQGRSGRH